MKVDWPDLDKTPQAAEEGEASKSTGESEGSKLVDKPIPTGAEGEAQAPHNKAVALPTGPH